MKENTSSFWSTVHSWFARQLNDQKPAGTIASLDGVRALAFLLVFAFHLNHSSLWRYGGSNPFFGAFFLVGNTGVLLFFVLSGFLLFLPYTQALLFKKEWPQSKIYYIRRILRIFPGYFFSLFILVILTQPAFLLPQNWGQLVPFLTFTMLFYNSSGLINGPYWTLAVEFQYYLILPLIAFSILALTRLVRPERRLWVVLGSLGAMIAWGLATACVGGYLFNHPNQTFLIPRSLLNGVLFVVYGDRSKFLEDFAVGMLIAVGYLTIMNSPHKERYLQKMRLLLTIFVLPAIALYIYAAMPGYSWAFVPRVLDAFPWLNGFAFALSYGYLVTMALCYRPESWLVRVFSWTPLRWLGLISYSLYIWHRPLIQLLSTYLRPLLEPLNPALMLALLWVIVFPICTAFCFGLFVFIEKPGMHLSERLRRQIRQREAQKHALSQPLKAYPQSQRDAALP